jgi:hypothetical protein
LAQKQEKQRLRELGQSHDSDEEEEDDDDDDEDEGGTDGSGAGAVDPANDPNMFGYINEDGQIVYVRMDEEEEDSVSAGAGMVLDGVPDADATAVVEKVSADLGSVAISDSYPSANAATAPTVAAAASLKAAVTTTPTPTQSEFVAMLPIRGDVASTTALSSSDSGGVINGLNQVVVTANQSMIARYFADRVSPCPRINAAIIIRGHTLYVYGGITELGDTEITLDDCWCLDLNKRDKWKQLLFGSMHTLVWKDDNDGTSTLGDDDSDCSDDSDYDSDEDEFDGCEDGDVLHENMEVDESSSSSVVAASGNKTHKAAVPSTTITTSTSLTGDTLTKTTHKSGKGSKSSSHISASAREEIKILREQLNVDDEASTPLAGEALRAFYSRTMSHWSATVLAKQTTEYTPSEKEVKRDGFKLAENRCVTRLAYICCPRRLLFITSVTCVCVCGCRYNELLPVLSRINELEDQQAEGQDDDREDRGQQHKATKKKDKDKDREKDKKKENEKEKKKKSK